MLNSRARDAAQIRDMIIIGNGRVGGGLRLRADRLGSRVRCLVRGDSLDGLKRAGGEPILVCTNAGDLSEVIHATPTWPST